MKRNWLIVILASLLVLACDPGDDLTEDGYSVESFTYNGTSCNKKCDQLCTPTKDKDCCKTSCDKPAAKGCKTDCDKKCLDQFPGDKDVAVKKCCKAACPPPPPEKCQSKCDDLCLKQGKPGDPDLKKKCCKKTCDTEPPPQKPVCDKQCADYLTKLGFCKKIIEEKCCKNPTPKCDTNDPKCKPPEPPKCDTNDPKCGQPEPPKCDKKDPKCGPPPPSCDPKCIKKLEGEGWSKDKIKAKCCK